VTERVATLQEIEDHWSLDDLVTANEALDAIKEAESEAQKRANKK
jgi:hypothetical protein